MMAFAFPNAVLQLFCKAPMLGQVKTRLQPGLSAAEALVVHQQLATRTFALAASEPLCPVQLWCTPATDHPFFTQAASEYGFSLHAQAGVDLGERMDNALQFGLAQASTVLLIGCDCPSLTVMLIQQALSVLQAGTAVVLAPTEDGGYSLIGLNAAQPSLFTAIPWSTPQVLTETQSKIAALGITAVALSSQWDVDTLTDYHRYQDLLAVEAKLKFNHSIQ